MNFFEKLNQVINTKETLLIVGLDPNPEMMPKFLADSQQSLMENLETWLTLIIEETKDLVCAYKPTLGFYEALGSKGLELLLNIITAIPDEIPIILDAKHGDLNTSTIFAKTLFEKWKVDAVTVTPYAGQDHIAPFLLYPDHGIFVLCHTSNPGAVSLQEYPTEDAPFYLQVIKEAKTWATPEQLFLEVGTTNLEVIKKIRSFAPERLLLMRSIWSQGNEIKEILKVALNSSGEGVLIPIPQDLLQSKNLREEVKNLKESINQYRNNITQSLQNCDLWSPNVCLLSPHPYQDLILQLYDIGCLLFGEYVQASGATFSYYIDLRKIISKPQLFHQVLTAYADILKSLKFERIAGIPYGSLPTATGLSLMLHHPMIYPRKEVKAHGTRRLIEGDFNVGEKVVVVDDILITGKSVKEGSEKLLSSGLIVEDIVVFIDHEQGVKDTLKDKGYNAYSVLTISEITETLYKAGRINEQQYQSFFNH